MGAKPTLAEQIACVDRGIVFLERGYRFSRAWEREPVEPKPELDRMRAVRHTLLEARLAEVDRKLLGRLQLTPEISRLIRELTADAYDERRDLGWLIATIEERAKTALERALEAVGP